MKYLEELKPGDLFILNNIRYVISLDFRLKNKNKQQMCISLRDGVIQWFDQNSIIEPIELYYRDSENNILPV
jgi:hypothetical protein